MRTRSIARAALAVALLTTSIFSYGQTSSAKPHHHHHHQAKATQTSATDVQPEMTAEDASKAIDMVYRDAVSSVNLDSYSNTALFSCNCTVHN